MDLLIVQVRTEFVYSWQSCDWPCE